MNVLLTFDVEVWCNDWKRLDEAFPSAFDRYVYGRSAQGNYALPKTLEILNANGLSGVFFVEPLFAARFGMTHLATIVGLIRDAGQDVQLHLHPEWVDEISPAIIPDNSVKRQQLAFYTLDEQKALIAYGKRMLLEVGAGPVSAFRAGNFGCNLDTFRALRANGILLDSSLNACYDVSGADLRNGSWRSLPSELEGVRSFPVSLFSDGLGQTRPVQVGGCGFGEMRAVLESAADAGQTELIIVSHNFEMLKPNSSQPDQIVVRRFEKLCRFLGENRDRLPTALYSECKASDQPLEAAQPRSGIAATIGRHVEQLFRRF